MYDNNWKIGENGEWDEERLGLVVVLMVGLELRERLGFVAVLMVGLESTD